MNKLDPQVTARLQQLKTRDALRPLSDRTLSVDEKIASLREMMRRVQSQGFPLEPVFRVEQLNLPGPAGKIEVRLYAPQVEASATKFLPALVYYHGGGFVAGDLDSHDTLLRALANRAECIVVSVAYRLAPENPYPAANEDAWAALSWVAAQGSAIGVDSARLAVGGDSAGGLLAAWVAQKANENGLKLRLQILLYPNLDATTSSASWTELGTGEYILSLAQMREWYDAYLPRGINRADPNVSPLFQTNLAGIAPAFIVTADHDPLRDEGNEYAAKLKAANVPIDHTCWPGMIHGQASLAGVLDAGKLLINQTASALRDAFSDFYHSNIVGSQPHREFDPTDGGR
jgi:acetyl esterase